MEAAGRVRGRARADDRGRIRRARRHGAPGRTAGPDVRAARAGLSAIMQASVDLVASGRDEKNAILAEDHADIEKFAASSRKLLATTIGDVNHFEQRVALDETRRAIQAMKKDLAEVQSGRERVLKLAVDGKDAEARAEAAKVRAIVDRVETAIDTMQADEERLGQQASDDATAEYVKARNLMLTLLGVA